VARPEQSQAWDYAQKYSEDWNIEQNIWRKVRTVAEDGFVAGYKAAMKDLEEQRGE